jgi:mannose-1-phosphate guanylyltransferase
MPTVNRDLWIVVLAGGEGTRLEPLTRALYGEPLPKQFAVIAGERSLLQQTVERALELAPAGRILIVVSAHHEATARAQLAPYPGVELVVQPKNLDTAPGMLLPLALIRARDPHARVVFLPSDHHVADAGPLLTAIACSATGPIANRLTLIGVQPDQPEVDYGWIVRGRRLTGPRHVAAFEVRRFREKPSEEIATRLRARGGLWNTFISTGPVGVYWQLARHHLPRHAGALERYAERLGQPDEAAALAAAYDAMSPANFSHEVLARATGLAVMPVAGSGWCDWGSPRRVFQSLRGTEHYGPLLARILEVGRPAAIAG